MNTIDYNASAAQSNTYGPDVYVNTADGSNGGSVAGCIDFSDLSACDATATAKPTETTAPAPTATLAATSSHVTVTSTATPRPRRP